MILSLSSWEARHGGRAHRSPGSSPAALSPGPQDLDKGGSGTRTLQTPGRQTFKFQPIQGLGMFRV